MKTNLLTLAVTCALGATAMAGTTYQSSKETKAVATVETISLYPDREFTIDLFGTYAFTQSSNERILGDHAFGGGLAANYFFTRQLGFGIEGQALKNQLSRGDDITGSAALNFFYRCPIGETGWAPYAYLGGGVIFNANDNSFDDFEDFADDLVDEDNDASDDVLFEGHAGVGVEYRITRNFGVFTDGRWTVVENGQNNFASVRTGVRFAF